MNVTRRSFLLLGLALIMGMSSLGLSGALAQDGSDSIDTSITVLEGACEGTPTTLTWIGPGTIPNWSPRGNPGEYLSMPDYQMGITMDVNECLTGWTLTGTMTDLTSAEGNVISASNHFILRVAPLARAQYDSPTQTCMFGTCWYPRIDHLGTSGPAYGSDINFGGAGPAYAADKALLTGDETATGVLHMYWQARLRGIETIASTTPPGTYTGTLTLTFTPTGP